MKSKIIKIILLALYAVGVITIATVGFVKATIQLNKDSRETVYYCIEEIHKHENYDCEWSYTYNQVHNADKGAECYVITCYTDDRVGEWFCYYKEENNIRYVDCDLAREWIIE